MTGERPMAALVPVLVFASAYSIGPNLRGGDTLETCAAAAPAPLSECCRAVSLTYPWQCLAVDAILSVLVQMY